MLFALPFACGILGEIPLPHLVTRSAKCIVCAAIIRQHLHMDPEANFDGEGH